MLETGNRIFNLKRIFNIRLGVNKSDDRLPKKLLKLLKERSAKDQVPNLDYMLKEYYRLDNILLKYLLKEYLNSPQ